MPHSKNVDNCLQDQTIYVTCRITEIYETVSVSLIESLGGWRGAVTLYVHCMAPKKMQVSPVEKPEYIWCLVTGQPYTDSEGQQSEYGRLETAASTRALCCTALQPTLGEGAEFDSPRPPLSRTSDLNLRLQGDKALSRSDDGKTRHCDDSRFSSSPSIFAWVFHLSLEWLYLFSGDGLWFLHSPRRGAVRFKEDCIPTRSV